MDASYPAWARAELQALAQRYGEPVIGVTQDPDAAKYLVLHDQTRRPGEVAMVVRRQNGKLLLATKEFYPAGVYRLLTGGVHRGESIFAALMRETHEETSLVVEPRRFLAVARYQEPDAPEPSEYATYAFLLDEVGGELGVNDPHERLSGFREVYPSELPAIADQLDNLPRNLRNDMQMEHYAWGRFRALAHRLVWQAINSASDQ